MADNSLHILLIDDDPDFIADFKALLPSSIICHDVLSVDESDSFLADHDVDVLFLDIDLGRGGNGLSYLKRIRIENPHLPVIMISANQEIHTVVKAMQLGASGYVGKSPNLDKLKIAIARAIEENRLRQRYALLKSELNELTGKIIGESEAIQAVKRQMKVLAEASSNVLITGRSGTGKELVARGIHRLSPNRDQPFIAVNCPALSRDLIQSELFGHEKGAFTGANLRHVGKFELVSEGTLFLDEVTEIPVGVQAKLLRVLQEREFERVGGNRLIPFRGRLLASSNLDIDQAVRDGKLREDLLYRLKVTHVHVPPLSERRDDIPALVDYFMKVKAREMKKKVPQITDKAVQLLTAYDWPGNVRELINCIENIIVHATGEILDVSDFSRCVVSDEFSGTYEEAKKRQMAEFQRKYIKAMLKKNDGKLAATARDMAITRQGLSKMMKSCGLLHDDL